MNIGKVSVKVNNTGLESVARTNGNDATVKIMLVKGPKGDDGGGLPSGGTTGQVLAKHSNASQDAEWKTLTASDVGALAADGAAASVAHKLKLYMNSTEYDFDGSTERELVFICLHNVGLPASLWSTTTDTNGYYTATASILWHMDNNYTPKMWCEGASSGVEPTTAQITAYNYIGKVDINDAVLTFYAKTKPTVDIYFGMKGVRVQ